MTSIYFSVPQALLAVYNYLQWSEMMKRAPAYHHSRTERTPHRTRDPTAPPWLRCGPPASWSLRGKRRKQGVTFLLWRRSEWKQTRLSRLTNGPRGEHCAHESNYFGSIQGRASIHQGDIEEKLKRGEGADELRMRLAVRKERMMEDVEGLL